MSLFGFGRKKQPRAEESPLTEKEKELAEAAAVFLRAMWDGDVDTATEVGVRTVECNHCRREFTLAFALGATFAPSESNLDLRCPHCNELIVGLRAWRG